MTQRQHFHVVVDRIDTEYFLSSYNVNVRRLYPTLEAEIRENPTLEACFIEKIVTSCCQNQMSEKTLRS